MSSKDYVAIGAVLSGEWSMTHSESIWRATLGIADKFAQDNVRFDRKKFYKFVFMGEDQFQARERIV